MAQVVLCWLLDLEKSKIFVVLFAKSNTLFFTPQNSVFGNVQTTYTIKHYVKERVKFVVFLTTHYAIIHIIRCNKIGLYAEQWSCKNTFVHTKNRKEATIHTIKWCKILFL